MENKRNTVQRQLILSAVRELNIHATADQVYEYVFHKYPTISKATVYRNLNQLAESGELLNIGSFNGSTHYDYQCHGHYHFICEVCRGIFDVEGDISDVLFRFKHTDGFDITGCNVLFTGSCWNCKTLQNQDAAE